MSVFEFHPDFTKLVKELSRIANALERIAIANGIPLEDSNPNEIEAEDIAYSSDQQLLKEEIQAAVDKMRPGASVNKVEEDV